MADMKPLLALSAEAVARIRKAVAADRDHLVSLQEDFRVGSFRETFRWRGRDLPILPYAGKILGIGADRVLTIYAGTTGDGASFFPDKIGGIDLAPGYIPHDAWYDEMDKIADDPAWKEAGWTRPAVRALGDLVLARMVEREERKAGAKRPWIAQGLHGAVRAVGGVYHWLAGLFALSAAVLLLSGCSGCADLPDGFDPGGDDPVYIVTPKVL